MGAWRLVFAADTHAIMPPLSARELDTSGDPDATTAALEQCGPLSSGARFAVGWYRAASGCRGAALPDDFAAPTASIDDVVVPFVSRGLNPLVNSLSSG